MRNALGRRDAALSVRRPLNEMMDAKVYTCYLQVMARGKKRHHSVLGTRELRDQIPAILRELRAEGANAEPIVGGANRKPEMVILSYDGYLDLLDQIDNLAIEAQARDQLVAADADLGTPLEDAARELGFDPDVIFAEAKRPVAKGALA